MYGEVVEMWLFYFKVVLWEKNVFYYVNYFRDFRLKLKVIEWGIV